MNSAEYAKLAKIEEAHWYYAGKREIVRYWLGKFGSPQAHDVLLDCGAGTGRFAKEMEEQCRVMVLDDHEEALSYLRSRFKPEQVLSLAGDQVPLADGSVNYITALDVLEHVPDDGAVVGGFHRLLTPGGLAVITVPAGMALWSDWDVVLHHHRRYDRRQLEALFPSDRWEIKYANYTNVVVYPLVWLLRRWRSWFPAGKGGARAEDRVPSPPVNFILQRSFVALARSRVPFPFGVSLLLVARKK
jgi:SAM-dependent methyltransferase